MGSEGGKSWYKYHFAPIEMACLQRLRRGQRSCFICMRRWMRIGSRTDRDSQDAQPRREKGVDGHSHDGEHTEATDRS